MRTQAERTVIRARGFTLVELLVVISIIVLLIGILIPVLSSVRNSARVTVATSLAGEVANASRLFQTEKRRLPGYFDARAMGNLANQTAQGGFTAAENVLLDLAGGAMPGASENAEQRIFRLGPGGESGNDFVAVAVDQVGATAGRYLDLGPDIIRPVIGQAGAQANYNPDETEEPPPYMPDIIDPWGMPMMVWVQDRSAPHDAYFASLNSGTPARFYLASNFGYTASRALTADRNSLNPVNQHDESLLGYAIDRAKREASLVGILGSPKVLTGRPLPLNAAFAEPAAARGDVVITSAGPDRVYFARQQDPSRGSSDTLSQDVLGFLRWNNNEPQPETEELPEFDDIVVSAG